MVDVRLLSVAYSLSFVTIYAIFSVLLILEIAKFISNEILFSSLPIACSMDAFKGNLISWHSQVSR